MAKTCKPQQGRSKWVWWLDEYNRVCAEKGIVARGGDDAKALFLKHRSPLAAALETEKGGSDAQA